MRRRSARLARLGAVGLAAATLAGCAALPRPAPPPVGVTHRAPPPSAPPASAQASPAAPPPRVIFKPVRAACVPKTLPPRPRYPDSDAALRAAAGAADRYQLMAAGRLLREKRLEELERIVDGCR